MLESRIASIAVLAMALMACGSSERAAPASDSEVLRDCLYGLDPDSGYGPDLVSLLSVCAGSAGLYHPNAERHLDIAISRRVAKLQSEGDDASAWKEIGALQAQLLERLRRSRLFCNEQAEKGFMKDRPELRRYRESEVAAWYETGKLGTWHEMRSEVGWRHALTTCGASFFGLQDDQLAVFSKDLASFRRWFTLQRTTAWLASAYQREQDETLKAALAAVLSSLEAPVLLPFAVVSTDRISASAGMKVTLSAQHGARLEVLPGGPFPGSPVALAELERQLASWNKALPSWIDKPLSERPAPALSAPQRQALQRARAAGLVRRPASREGRLQATPPERLHRPRAKEGEKPLVTWPQNSAPLLIVTADLPAARVLDVARHMPRSGAFMRMYTSLAPADAGVERTPFSGQIQAFGAFHGALDSAPAQAVRLAHVLIDGTDLIYWDVVGKRQQVTRKAFEQQLQSDKVDALLVGATAKTSTAQLVQLLEFSLLVRPRPIALPTPGLDERYGGRFPPTTEAAPTSQ